MIQLVYVWILTSSGKWKAISKLPKQHYNDIILFNTCNTFCTGTCAHGFPKKLKGKPLWSKMKLYQTWHKQTNKQKIDDKIQRYTFKIVWRKLSNTFTRSLLFAASDFVIEFFKRVDRKTQLFKQLQTAFKQRRFGPETNFKQHTC